MPAQYSSLIMMVGVFVIMYLFLIKPQQKKEKEIQNMRDSVKVGNNVITVGGIHGKILNIKDDVLTIEVGADKTKLQIARWGIATLKQDSKE